MNQASIRNFCIVAHVDSGKSTLADRFLELTGTVNKRDLSEQTLDSHPISRERGITIKLAPVTMHYEFPVLSSQFSESEGPTVNRERVSTVNEYVLNLIDTPGHVDFSYEVERSLAACEGTILLVDGTQGVQAQTLSHFQKAQKLGLTIIPVINKVDLRNARVEEIEQEIRELFTVNREPGSTVNILKISAKTGMGVAELLEAVIKFVPAPAGKPEAPTRALVFSSQFDPHRGVIVFIRIVDGAIRKADLLQFLATHQESEALEVGHFTPRTIASDSLETGEVGYVATNLKDIARVQVCDTITVNCEPGSTVNPLSGYSPAKPMVFVSFFPVDQDEFKNLEEGLDKLKLNDSALAFGRTESKALGRGFRVGFLGHLHAEVSQQRLEEDFGLSVIATTPTVEFKKTTDYSLPSTAVVSSQSTVDHYLEPWVSASIIVPQAYVGAVMTLCDDRRGKLVDMVYHGSNANLAYELPLTEIITDFYDQLKSKTSGYGSLDYSILEYRPFNSVTLSILINHQEVDALTQLVEKSKALNLGNKLVERLKEAIPQQQIPIPIQAAVNGQVIARADISAFRKDVTAKLYGGDVTRRKKLLEKQKKGKEKMKQIGMVTIPNDTFLKIFKT